MFNLFTNFRRKPRPWQSVIFSLAKWSVLVDQKLERIMVTTAEIKTVLLEVKSNTAEVKSKTVAVLTKLAELQAAGNGATQEELADLLSLSKEVSEGQQSIEDAIDAATAEAKPAEGTEGGEATAATDAPAPAADGPNTDHNEV